MRIVRFSDGMYGVKNGFWLFAKFLDNNLLVCSTEEKIPHGVEPWHSVREKPESLHKRCKFVTLSDCATAIINYERLTKRQDDKDPFSLKHTDVR